MEFRDKLLATLRAARPVLEVQGVLVIGSEVPNLLQPGAASSLVVSEDVDLGVPVACHGAVKEALRSVVGLQPSPQEPSVWLPVAPGLIELNLVGMDPAIDDPLDSYVLEDAELPLMVFGNLSFMRAAVPLDVEGLLVPLPRTAGLLIEKLLTDRSGTKGERDLLVALGLIVVATSDDLDELTRYYQDLDAELRHAVVSNLTILSLMKPHPHMPDPVTGRGRVAALLRRLEEAAGP